MGASASTAYTQGGSWGLRFVPLSDIMEQVHACLVPAERDFLLACLDEVHRRCDSLINGRKQAAKFHEQGAVEALLEMLSMFKLDEVFLRQAVKTLFTLCEQDDGILYHFLDLGGRDAVDETLEMHKGDQTLVQDCNQIASIIRKYAKGVARRDAAQVAKAFRYCHTCRPLVDCPSLLGSVGNGLHSDQGFLGRADDGRRVYRGGANEEDGGIDNDYLLDAAADDIVRIGKLMEHMDKFPKILDVVEPCVDALIAVGKSGDTEAVLESRCAWNLVKAMKAFPDARSLQWKGLLATIHLAKRDEVCFDLGKAGVVQLLVVMWPKWEDDEMRQLLLWAMNEVARLETNQLRMSAERVGALLRETMEPASSRLATTGTMVTAEQAGHYCVPIKLRRLYQQRKLGGPFAGKQEEAGADSANKAALVGAPLPKPLFGRVGDSWKEGEAGLI